MHPSTYAQLKTHSTSDGDLHEMSSIADLRTRYDISRSTIYRLLAAGLIDGRKVGTRTLISLSSVRQYLNSQPRVAVKPDNRSVKLGAPVDSQAA